MTEVKKWLNGERNYTEGIALYSKYGKNPKLKTFFATKDNDFAVDKLAYELEKIDNELQLPTIVEKAKPNAKVGVDVPKVFITPFVNESEDPSNKEGVDIANVPSKPTGENQNYPAELCDMVIERQHLVNQKGILANSLANFGEKDDEGRKGVMDKIATIRERINTINDTERYFIKNQSMPKPTDTVEKFDILSAPYPNDKAELLKWKKSLSEMRSKGKKKLENIGENSKEGQILTIKIGKINERYEAVEKALSGGHQ
jgi:hypothetical protein